MKNGEANACSAEVSTLRLRLSRLSWICLALFVVAIVLIWPVAETGIMDDWSIARTAQMLAETGHLHYNGWEAPMLGWPLYVAAPFIRAFGFSYTLVRLTTMFEACATVVLLQRTFVLAGLDDSAAALGTLTVALSPIFLMTSVTFMTDVPGAFAVIAALYGCLRATKAGNDRAAAAWICFAAIANAVLGTARQVAWLGALVIVPCALWLLRRRRRVLMWGVAGLTASVAFILVSLHWLNHQPYVLPERLIPPAHEWSPRKLALATKALCYIGLDLVMFSLPAAFGFLEVVRQYGRRAWLRFRALSAGALVAYAFIIQHFEAPHLLAPFLLYTPIPAAAENTFTTAPIPIMGPAPEPLSRTFQLGLTDAVLLGVCCLLAALYVHARSGRIPGDEEDRAVLWLTVPFALCYLLLLLPRALWSNIAIDRYLILLLPFVLLLLLLGAKRMGVRTTPVVCTVAVGAIGCYSVLTLHNVFALYRAHAAAIAELRAAGVPATAIDGGMEYNRTTQILQQGYVRAGGIRMPDGSLFRESTDPDPVGPCVERGLNQTPVVKPLYAIAFPSAVCAEVPGFAPVRFVAWLPPFHREVHVVRYGSGKR